MNELLLETDRLILRMWQRDDFEPYARMCGDAEVMHFLNAGKPFERYESWRSMAQFVGHWWYRGFGHWAVVEKATGDFVGRVGFLDPEGWPDFELGWTLRRESWGRGYATEAATRALQHAFGEMGRDRVISLIVPDNRRSIRVAERLGFEREHEIEFLGKTTSIYATSRSRWQARTGVPPV